ncbi:MAG: hypothetical protein CMM02_14900 [Rhodopirellula sp.]|nr:hypothetical protein [Rhodopirellula sp.]
MLRRYLSLLRRLTTVAVLVLSIRTSCGAQQLPEPGIGLLIQSQEIASVRAKITQEPWAGQYKAIEARADELVAAWAQDKLQMDDRLEKILDLTIEFDAVTKDEGSRELAKLLAHHMQTRMTSAAFVYLITGEKQYAETAFDVLVTAARVNRWGWFTWSGAAMPQIHAGMYARNSAFTVDFIWSALTDAQRQQARDILAEKVVEPYYRLVLHTPAMGLHHLRSKNQGNNVFSGAMIGCLALGRDYPDAQRWFSSFLQTYHWLLAHDIGWAGQGLEAGMPGYWSVSMQNLYTAAVCLHNARGVDLRNHPGFEEATYYPIMHESTVPPVGMFREPISKAYQGIPGIISGKPIELPGSASGSAWWYDFAYRNPKSAAAYFINQSMVRLNSKKEFSFASHNAHQSGHSDIITLLWTRPEVYQPNVSKPTDLFKTTDRMSMLRSGYGMGHTYMYVNGDIFLSSLGEILGTSSGMSWHYKWHGYQAAETGIVTEGEPLAPSMKVNSSWDGEKLSIIHSSIARSNIQYYKPKEHDNLPTHYQRRDRDIVYVKDVPGRDYFIFIDHVQQEKPRFHGWQWQTWNHVFANDNVNAAVYERVNDRYVRLKRPNADLGIQLLVPQDVEFEIESAPGQPKVSYMYDHNLLTLRAIAGKYKTSNEQPVVIAPKAWSGRGKLVHPSQLEDGLPESAYYVKGKTALVEKQGVSLNQFQSTVLLKAGHRYRMRVQYKKDDLAVYENLAWKIPFTLLDAEGNVVVKCSELYNIPDPLSLRDNRSMTKTTDWISTDYVYFSVPEGRDVAILRGELLAAEYSHPPNHIHDDSILQLGPVTIEPLGRVLATTSQTFVALLNPLEKSTELIQAEVEKIEEATVIKIPRGEFEADWIVVDARKPVTFQWGTVAAEFAWFRIRDDETIEQIYLRKAAYLALEGQEIFKNSGPLDLALNMNSVGQISHVRASVDGATELTMFGRTYPLGNGIQIADANLRFRSDPTATTLESNSISSQQQLRQGLAPVLDAQLVSRDESLALNLAREARVTASASRAVRFSPYLTIDNKTSEYPLDGKLDYTQRPIATSTLGGYGPEKHPLVSDPMATFPFYVSPTYWLLPYQQQGWIEYEWKKDRQVSEVRVLNTANAGLNDFATIDYRIELRDVDGEVIVTQSKRFGKVFDRPFKAAFKYPEHFGKYSETFAGMLEPGVPVPFGDGWQSTRFNAVKARKVRIYIDSYWGLGGGLNEVQIYPE